MDIPKRRYRQSEEKKKSIYFGKAHAKHQIRNSTKNETAISLVRQFIHETSFILCSVESFVVSTAAYAAVRSIFSGKLYDNKKIFIYMYKGNKFKNFKYKVSK